MFSSVTLLVFFTFLVQQTQTFCPTRGPRYIHSNQLKTKTFHSTPAFFGNSLPTSFFDSIVLQARKKGAADDDEDDVDIPGDWNEDDILAEFDDVDISNEDDSQDDNTADEEEVVVDEVVDEDDEEDDDDIDEIDLDEEDDEDDEDEIEMVDETDAESEEDYEYADEDEGEWEDDEEEYYELEDDDDPNYAKTKELAEIAAEKAYERARDEAFDPIDFMMNDITEDQQSIIEKSEIFKRVQERMKGMELTEMDVEDIDFDEAVAKVPDLMDDDPYPRHEDGEENILTGPTGLTDDDMEELDRTYKMVNERVQEEPWDKVLLKDLTGWESLSNETLEEMEDCLEEIGGSSYNVTKWLLYDLDFNVTNLILAATKHNREAPILFQHWYPQLVTYKKYQSARDRDFDFTWEDVENADMSELERYYAGFGYDEIPKKAPFETGIISLEELDEDEIKMAAFDSWMKEVYNPEWDRKDFDDDDMQDEDNVFSQFYEAPQHPDKPTFEDSLEDIEMWNEEMGDDKSVREYRDMMGQAFEYEVVKDEEFEREFRGHLIIACTGDNSDLDIAEKITLRFEKEFGKQVFVETRIMQLARLEDNVFEIWLESYEVDLLHSKKRATSNAKGWDGPAECDDAQIDYLVDRVRFLISDEARYSYRMEDPELTAS